MLIKKGVLRVGNTCLLARGRPAFASESKDITAPLISSNSLESSFISACSGMGNFGIIDGRRYTKKSGFTQV